MKAGVNYIMEGIRRAQFRLRQLEGSFGVGVVMPDGTVQEFGGQGRTWSSVDTFHEARGMQEARLIVHHAGDVGGYFGTGVVLPAGDVEKLGGRERWPTPEAFLLDAGGQAADLVLWCAPR